MAYPLSRPQKDTIRTRYVLAQFPYQLDMPQTSEYDGTVQVARFRGFEVRISQS